MATAEALEPITAFPNIESVSYPFAVASVGRAAYTLFRTPEHEKLHQVVEGSCVEGPFQPLQAPIDETVRRVREDVLPNFNLVRPPATDGARLVHLGGVLIQFGDYIPKMHDTIKIPYGTVADLHQAITERATETEPLGYAEQLGVALERTDGNLTESMWQLFITSRFYARWLDSKIIQGVPDYTKDEKVARMLEWRAAIAACKEPNPEHAQDPNGDNYYAWTHALAKVAYTVSPAKETATSRATVSVFERGTNLMHKIVHTFNKQGVQSDHSIAAGYGNAVGQACIDAVA